MRDGVGPFSIFDDHTLEEILTIQPRDEVELEHVRGVSVRRVEKDGAAIMNVLYKTLWPDEELPERPFFTTCSGCGGRLVLATAPGTEQKVYCRSCRLNQGFMVREQRAQLKVRLPRQSDFD